MPLGAATTVITVGLLVWHPTLAAGQEPIHSVKSDRRFSAAETGIANGSGQR